MLGYTESIACSPTLVLCTFMVNSIGVKRVKVRMQKMQIYGTNRCSYDVAK